jgi:hypothetical protein
MKPNKCGVLISVEVDKEQNMQFLKVIEMQQIIDYSVYEEVRSFCENNNTYYVRVAYETNSKDPRL